MIGEPISHPSTWPWVNTNGILFWLVGEFTHFRSYFSGWIGMFTGGGCFVSAVRRDSAEWQDPFERALLERRMEAPAYVSACVRVCVCACERACVRAWVGGCVCVCVVCVCVCVPKWGWLPGFQFSLGFCFMPIRVPQKRQSSLALHQFKRALWYERKPHEGGLCLGSEL